MLVRAKQQKTIEGGHAGRGHGVLLVELSVKRWVVEVILEGEEGEAGGMCTELRH